MYTVCGHAQPHQMRPNSAVTAKMPTKTEPMSSAKMGVSVGSSVWPKK